MTSPSSKAGAPKRAELQTQLQGTTDNLRTRVDLSTLITPEHYAKEREKIFRRAWMTIGHTDDLPSKGSYFTYEVPTFNMSLLVVRGGDGAVRVFHNACRHRGNKLEQTSAGTRRDFMCNFHGWTFSLEGKLQDVTDPHQFEAFDKEDYGLIPVTSEVWENLIFVNFDEKPGETLAEWLGDEFFEQYHGYFDLHEKVADYSFVLNCNWHLAVNAFTEGYHTLYLHRNTARDYQGGKANPQRHRPHMALMKRHHRYSAPGNPDHRQLPVEALAIKHGRKMLPAFDFDFSMLPPGVNEARYPHWAFDIIELFPNFVAVAGNHFRAEFHFWPIDAGRTLVTRQVYNYRTKNLGERISRGYFQGRGRDVVREDLSTLEAQQAILASGVVPHVLLSRQEMALQHHFAVSADMLAED
jgi:glycine betaine catabolism A